MQWRAWAQCFCLIFIGTLFSVAYYVLATKYVAVQNSLHSGKAPNSKIVAWVLCMVRLFLDFCFNFRCKITVTLVSAIISLLHLFPIRRYWLLPSSVFPYGLSSLYANVRPAGSGCRSSSFVSSFSRSGSTYFDGLSRVFDTDIKLVHYHHLQVEKTTSSIYTLRAKTLPTLTTCPLKVHIDHTVLNFQYCRLIYTPHSTPNRSQNLQYSQNLRDLGAGDQAAQGRQVNDRQRSWKRIEVRKSMWKIYLRWDEWNRVMSRGTESILEYNLRSCHGQQETAKKHGRHFGLESEGRNGIEPRFWVVYNV